MASCTEVYEEELVKRIRLLFVRKIIPQNFLHVVHRYNTNVLTLTDIARLHKKSESNIPEDVSQDLLDCLRRYDGWFDCMLLVLQDQDMKQANLVPVFMNIKREVDEKFGFPSGDETFPKLSDVGAALDAELRPSDFSLEDTERDGVNVQEANDGSAGGNGEDIVTTTEDGQFWCSVCQLKLSSVIVRNAHLIGARHFKMLLKLLKSTPSGSNEGASQQPHDPAPMSVSGQEDDDTCTLESDGSGRCNLCRVTFGSRQVGVDHMNCKAHKKKLEAYKSGNMPTVTTRSMQADSSSSVCPMTPAAAVGTSAGAFDEIESDIYKRSSDGSVLCHVCSLTFPSEQTGDAHFGGKNHKKKAAKHKEKVEQLKLASGPNGEMYLLVNGVGTCFVCGSKKLSGADQVKSHFESASHKKKCSSLTTA